MDITDIRDNNIKIILNALRFSNGMTKKEISEITQLSFSTVSNTCNLLIQKDVLSYKKSDNNGVGRTPNSLTLNYDKFCIICIDLNNRNFMSVMILNLQNDVIDNQYYSISNCKTVDEIINLAKESYNSFLKNTNINYKCIGIGISMPGIFNKNKQKIVNSYIHMFNECPIKEIVNEIFDMPCFVNTESNFCALGIQHRMSSESDFVYINLSSEISAGAVCNNRLVEGNSGHAMRVAHLPLGNMDIICSEKDCSNYGCINSEISLKGMLCNFDDNINNKSLTEQWNDFVKVLRNNPKEYESYLKEKSEYISSLIVTLVCIFDPSTVYLGGVCSEIYDLMQPFISRDVRMHCPLAYDSGLKLLCDHHSLLTLLEGMTYVAFSSWNPLNI